MSRLIVFLFLFLSAKTPQELQMADLNNIPLKIVGGNNTYQLKQVRTPLLAIVFLSPECPLCQNYTRTLNEITQQYPGKITVVGIFPGRWYTAKDYLDFQKKYKVAFPLLMDADKILTQTIHGTVTPEVFLLDEARHVKYSGAIDNWAITLGQHRKAATLHYLAAAIDGAIAGKPLATAHVKPVGCYINDN